MRRLILTACAALSLAGMAAAQERPPEDQRPDFDDMSQAEIQAVTRAMPKGGDLHIHLSGAPYGETYLAWAAEDGLCVDTVRWALTDPCTPEGDLILASALTPDQRATMLDSFSTRRPGFAGRNGHDQFFTAFDRFGWTRDYRRGDMLADLMNTLARQNTFYVEAMVTPQSGAARELGRSAGWTADLTAMDAALAAGLPALVTAAIAETDAAEARARLLLGCDGPQPQPGCQVTVRFLAQANRLSSPEQTYAQMALADALIQADPRWVGLQLVAPEDHPSALANYRTHMAMVGHLVVRRAGLGGTLRAALHAGELTHDYATPETLSFHVSAAVYAGARRIGHGISIPHETDAHGLVERMRAEGVAVEINLTSNAVILGIEGDEHPVHWLREAGVPVIYTTDDPGISRSDLSMEYARAVVETDADYEDLVTSGRNALAFSFLPGEGLWADPGRYTTPVGACADQMARERPEGACAALLERSSLAREQWRYERLLGAFETRWATTVE